MERFTIRQLKEIEPSLSRLLDAKLDIKVSYRITKFTKKVLKELMDVERARQKYVQDHGIVIDGRRQVPPLGVEEFQKAMDALLDEEVEIPVMKVKLEELAPGNLTVADVANLDFIIEDQASEPIKPQPAP